jgi:hypothetical protein
MSERERGSGHADSNELAVLMGGNKIRDVGEYWVAVLTTGHMREWSYRISEISKCVISSPTARVYLCLCHRALLLTRQRSASSHGRQEGIP